MTQNNSLIL
jgi:homocitrate synthase